MVLVKMVTDAELKLANYVTPAKIPTIIYLLFYTKAGNP